MGMGAIALAKTGWTEASLTVALKNRFAGSAYAFLPQVANGTGGAKSRTADALVMSLWPSRGLDLIGFEIKISRSDWLQELKRPEKAETIAKYCDAWYIVVASEEIVKLGELPSAWGLMAPKGKVLRIVKEATFTPATPITRSFLAALLRNASGAIVPKAQIEDELKRAREEGRKAGEQTGHWKVESAKRELEHLRESVTKFETASGLKIDNYNGRTLGEAVALVRSRSIESFVSDLRHMRSVAEGIAASIENGLHEFEQQATGKQS
jgi:hypothetical protein